MIDTQTISTRLNHIEEEIKQLRELLRPEIPSEQEANGGHLHVETVPTVLSGEPVIRGTRTPVRAIVEHWKFGDSPEEISRKLPHLRLAQIFGALSYYDDHREEIEHYIALNRVPVDE
jgi:uncharacterized protein (DUF433 family)